MILIIILFKIWKLLEEVLQISHKTTSYIDSNGNTVPQQDADLLI